jgi:integrase
MNTIREGGNAVIVRHCAVFGVSREPVRTFKVWPVERYAQYERTVTVHYVKPGKREKWGFHVVHDDLTYVTIEQDNYLVYDRCEPRKNSGDLEPEEVARLLEAAPGPKYKAALSAAYAAGLRVSEVVLECHY